jgi:hypothetical protein
VVLVVAVVEVVAVVVDGCCSNLVVVDGCCSNLPVWLSAVVAVVVGGCCSNLPVSLSAVVAVVLGGCCSNVPARATHSVDLCPPNITPRIGQTGRRLRLRTATTL